MNFWEEIQQYLTDKGYVKESLNSLRKFIDVPDDPTELPCILENLRILLKYLNSIVELYPEHLTEIVDVDWEDTVHQILAYPEWKLKTARFCKAGEKPLWGIYETHPVYVAVWTRPTFKSGWNNYFGLLAHVCLAVSNLRNRMQMQNEDEELTLEEIDNFKYRIKKSLLTVRNLAEIDNRHILEGLPDLDLAPDKLIEALQNDKLLREEISPLFKFLLKLRRSAHRHPGEVHHPRRHRNSPHLESPAFVVNMDTNLDPEQEGLVPQYDVMKLPTTNKEDAINIELDGCLPGESESGAEIAIAKTADKKIRSSKQKANKGRQIKNQLAMRNQNLPCRWEALSLYEVTSFLQAVTDLFFNGTKSKYYPGTGIVGELIALVNTIFWCSKRIKNVVDLRCYQGSVPNDATEPGFIAESDSIGYWWTVPALRTRIIFPDEYQKTKTHNVINAFPIHSGTGIENLISMYIREIHGHKRKLLFPKKLKFYEEAVGSFLSKVNQHHRTRLTANRVADYLFDKISVWNGADLTTSMYLTGRHHYLGYNPSSYTAIPVSTLQVTYRDVCRSIYDSYVHEMSEKLKDSSFNIALPPSVDYVGTPFLPTKDTVKELVLHLKEKLKASENQSPSILKLMRLHKYMTQYTSFLIGFCTGFRAVRDPFLSAAEIDWRTGFCILSDKDSEDRYNSRLIWIPPVCLEQLKYFREHTHNALYRFSNLVPDLYAQLESPRRQGPGRYMFFVTENMDNSSFNILSLGPKLVGDGLNNLYPLPFNASRHYLRSNLLKRRCPVEVINALMGHYERGEEPWGTYSGLSPLAYRDSLQKYLLELIEEIEWKALPGLGAEL